jgi:hypothetical protein
MQGYPYRIRSARTRWMSAPQLQTNMIPKSSHSVSRRSCVIVMQRICSRKGKINKIAKPYEILGFMISLKSTRKTRGAARNAGSNYRQRQFVPDLDRILFSQPRNSKSSEIRFGDHGAGHGTWELFTPNLGIDSQRKSLSADSVTELWVMSEEGRFPKCCIKASWCVRYYLLMLGPRDLSTLWF